MLLNVVDYSNGQNRFFVEVVNEKTVFDLKITLGKILCVESNQLELYSNMSSLLMPEKLDNETEIGHRLILQATTLQYKIISV